MFLILKDYKSKKSDRPNMQFKNTLYNRGFEDL